MATHGRAELAKVDRIIREQTQVSFMSDTKWRKVISCLNKPEFELKVCVAQFLDTGGEHILQFPLRLDAPRPWFDSFEYGPIPLRSVQWLLIPHLVSIKRGNMGVPDGQAKQNTMAVSAALATLGKIPVQVTERGLRITGHIVAQAG